LTVAVNKTAPLLHRWSEWSKTHVTQDTLLTLNNAASTQGVGGGPDTWFIYLGVLPARSIVECVRVKSGEVVEDWGEINPPEYDVPAVPTWRRDAWQRNMLSKVRKAIRTQKG
jgi:hypothetical protein